MMLFPKALFLATTFPKIVKNSIFPLNFYQKFLKISQQFEFFVQTAKNGTNRFVNSFEKYAQIMDFFNFLKKILKNFETFSKFQKLFVVKMRDKLTHGLLIFFEKYAKIMHF